MLESFEHPESDVILPHGNFDFAQEMFQNMSKARVIDEIVKDRSLETFHSNIAAIDIRLSQGKITTTRQLELELICAGKVSTYLESRHQ